MTFDPEQNRIPTGLLTDEERAALKSAKYGWQVFECGGWICHPKPRWHNDIIYRAKPAPAPTIMVNGIEVPEPVREALEDGQLYWLVDPMHVNRCIRGMWKTHWFGDDIAVHWLSRGLIHLTEEAAVAHAKAMLAPSMRGDV